VPRSLFPVFRHDSCNVVQIKPCLTPEPRGEPAISYTSMSCQCHIHVARRAFGCRSLASSLSKSAWQLSHQSGLHRANSTIVAGTGNQRMAPARLPLRHRSPSTVRLGQTTASSSSLDIIITVSGERSQPAYAVQRTAHGKGQASNAESHWTRTADKLSYKPVAFGIRRKREVLYHRTIASGTITNGYD
jgi:hypothetical protein